MNVTNRQAQVGSARARRVTVAGSVLLLMQLAATAQAGPNEQAKRIYERLVGEEPPAAILTQMASAITANPGQQGLLNAAQIATQQPDFYNVVVKNLVTPWSNRDQTVFAPLNDYTATVIGMVRDDVPFNTALSADILYTVKGVSPAPSNSSNAHYATAETKIGRAHV
jgi:hypothetical protein